MLEVYEKKNGEYVNKSIKVNDLGMNQQIEFTVTGTREMDSKFALTDKDKKPILDDGGNEIKAKAYLISGIYHKNNGDVEVSMWFNQSKKNITPTHVKDLMKNEGEIVTIKKAKKEGAKFHYYEIKKLNGGDKLNKVGFPLEKMEKEAVDALKADNTLTREDWIATIVKAANVSGVRAGAIYEQER